MTDDSLVQPAADRESTQVFDADLIRTVPPESEEIAHYCIVRTDIPVGRQSGYILHAAAISAHGKHTDGCYAISLAARDEAHLRQIRFELERARVPLESFVETDQPYGGQLMSIGLVPGPRKQLRKYLSQLPTVKG